MAGRGLSREALLYRAAAERSSGSAGRLKAAALRFSAGLPRKTAEHNTQDAALLLEQLADEQE